MSPKSKKKKNELNEEFIAIWREEQTSRMLCPLCIDTEMKNTKSIGRLKHRRLMTLQ